jgi:hypothetical protein
MCEVLPNTSFVLVRVPIRVAGDGTAGEATFRYSIGAFTGRNNPMTLRADLQTTFRFRIPLELFLAGERLIVEVLAGGSGSRQTALWTGAWEIAWQGKNPALQALSG